MTLFQCMLFYAVTWWLVLFMVLPWGAKAPTNPAPGHASSAPENPRLKRKMLITSLLALLVTLVVYSVSEARAESGMYHAGSGSKPASDVYSAKSDDCASADLAATDDVNLPDTATMDGGMPTDGFENVPTYLDAPASDYSNNPQLGNTLYGGGVVNVGVASTNTKTGEVTLNGQKISGNRHPAHCQ